jgi:glycine betaine catabolism B
VNWKAGQYYYFTLPALKYPDSRGSTRHFTISSSPTEGQMIRLTTRIRDESGYKQTLDELPIGTIIEGDGPTGTFIMDEMETGPHVFLAGGIGITPFRSMIKYIIDKKLETPIYLVYSNSIPEEIAFKKELEDITKKHSNIKVAFTVSRPEESKERWSGVKGRIDENLLRSLIEKWQLEIGNLIWWICGPPAMTDAIEQVLGKMKITSDKIRSEKFTGY